MDRDQDRADAAGRVKRWTRERFGDVTVMVTELESARQGSPGMHTVVAFWSAERKHYHFRISKPLEQVAEADIPPAREREALEVIPGVDCRCC